MDDKDKKLQETFISLATTLSADGFTTQEIAVLKDMEKVDKIFISEHNEERILIRDLIERPSRKIEILSDGVVNYLPDDVISKDKPLSKKLDEFVFLAKELSADGFTEAEISVLKDLEVHEKLYIYKASEKQLLVKDKITEPRRIIEFLPEGVINFLPDDEKDYNFRGLDEKNQKFLEGDAEQQKINEELLSEEKGAEIKAQESNDFLSEDEKKERRSFLMNMADKFFGKRSVNMEASLEMSQDVGQELKKKGVSFLGNVTVQQAVSTPARTVGIIPQKGQGQDQGPRQ